MQVTWIKTIDAKLENIRSALDWSTNGGNVSDAYRLVGNLRVYFIDQGRLSECFRLADRLAGRSSGIAPIYRSRVHFVNGHASGHLGDDIRAEAEFTSAARLAEEAGHEREAAIATHNIFVCALRDPRRYVEVERRLPASSPGIISYALLGMAAVASLPERSLCLLVSSDTLLDLDNRVRDYAEKVDFDFVMDRVKRSIDPERFIAISDASRRLSADEAVAYALGERELPWVTSDG